MVRVHLRPTVHSSLFVDVVGVAFLLLRLYLNEVLANVRLLGFLCLLFVVFVVVAACGRLISNPIMIRCGVVGFCLRVVFVFYRIDVPRC